MITSLSFFFLKKQCFCYPGILTKTLCLIHLSPFVPNFTFIFPLKKSEIVMFSDALSGIEREHWEVMG